MAMFERKPANKTVLDDTDPLSCNIEGYQKHDDHIEYIVSVQRGWRGTDKWRVRHRYKDFAELHDALAACRLELPLPRKKMFGNMDQSFVEDRRQGLQVFLDTVLAHPLLAHSLAVKRFLDPPNYPASLEAAAAQAVQLALRGSREVSLAEPLAGLGWRPRKHHQVAGLDGGRHLLTWSWYGPDRCLPLPQMALLNRCLSGIQFPYIQTHKYSQLAAAGGLHVSAFCPAGSLRDVMAGSRPGAVPLLAQLAAGRPKCALLYNDICNIGRQILEALRLLHSHGIPYGHLHSGNVLYDGGVCRLTDLENAVWGLPPFYRAYLVRHRRLGSLDAADLYGLGHVLHQLTFGRPLHSDHLDELPPDLMPDLSHVLSLLLSAESLKRGVPTVEELLQMPLFRDVVLPLPVTTCSLNIGTQCRELFRAVKTAAEQRLQADQALYRHHRRLEKSVALLNDEEKRSVRRQLQRKRQQHKLQAENVSDSGSSGSLPRTSSPSSSCSASTAPPPPPPPPPPGGAAGSPSGPGDGAADAARGALLDSIWCFSKARLRPTETDDRSGAHFR